MPLTSLNVRAAPLGLETSKQFLREELEKWLTCHQEADVTFIYTKVDSDIPETMRLAAHQAVLAPVSEVLREMFSLQNCGHVRNMVNISIDCDPEVSCIHLMTNKFDNIFVCKGFTIYFVSDL